MNNRGQALIEFILILPILLFIVLATIDFGNIYSEKCSLENKSSEIVDDYLRGDTVEDISKLYDGIEISVINGDKYDTITINKYVKISTPGLSNIMGNPYLITVTRYVNHD